jgi:isochorismate hydrolase
MTIWAVAVGHALALVVLQSPDRPGAAIVNALQPQAEDHLVLQSTPSGFFQTPLETMLRSGGAKTLVLAGFATDHCVLCTAADAYMRDFTLILVTDCLAAQSSGGTPSRHHANARAAKARAATSKDVSLRREVVQGFTRHGSDEDALVSDRLFQRCASWARCAGLRLLRG